MFLELHDFEKLPTSKMLDIIVFTKHWIFVIFVLRLLHEHLSELQHRQPPRPKLISQQRQGVAIHMLPLLMQCMQRHRGHSLLAMSQKKHLEMIKRLTIGLRI